MPTAAGIGDSVFLTPSRPALQSPLLHGQSRRTGERYVGLYDFIFPIHNKEAYYKLFGRAGFHEYQTLVPFEKFADYIDAVRKRLEKCPLPITLASAKIFNGERELLRFRGKGICLALNFPHCVEGVAFAQFLDGLVAEIGAIPNIIKDSRLTVEVVSRTYPGYETFRERLHAFDPARLYRSELSERLRL